MTSRRDFLKSVALLVLCLFIGFSAPLQAADNPPLVLVVGWDAMDYRSATQLIDAGFLPNLAKLNLYMLRAWPTTSVTKPGWSEIETGLGGDTTKIINNKTYNSQIKASWTIYGILRSYYPSCWVSTIHSKRDHTGDRITDGKYEPFYWLKQWALAGGMDRYVNPSIVLPKGFLTINQTSSYLYQHIDSYKISSKKGGLIFAHFSDPDATGHKYGMGSIQWNNKVIQLDQILGEAITALNPDFVFIVSDHGFNDFGVTGHGNAPQGIIASNIPLRGDGIRCDVTPTILEIFQIVPDGGTPPLYGKSLLVQ